MAKYNRAQQKVAQQRVAIKLPAAIELAETKEIRVMQLLNVAGGGVWVIPFVRRVK